MSKLSRRSSPTKGSMPTLLLLSGLLSGLFAGLLTGAGCGSSVDQLDPKERRRAGEPGTGMSRMPTLLCLPVAGMGLALLGPHRIVTSGEALHLAASTLGRPLAVPGGRAPDCRRMPHPMRAWAMRTPTCPWGGSGLWAHSGVAAKPHHARTGRF